MLNQKDLQEDEALNKAVFTPLEVARLLKVDITTIELWSHLGILHDSRSSENSSFFRWSEVLTFLSEENRVRHILKRMQHGLEIDISQRKERDRLARITVQAITDLTKHSVAKISHLCNSPIA
jgi:predicted site-specific integrase-resolvase